MIRTLPRVDLARIPWPVVAVVAAYLVGLLAWPAWTVDDAYITLRYARNLVEHGALTWNLTDSPPVEGYTGLIWTLLAAGAVWSGLPPLVLLDVAGVVSSLAVLGLAAALLVELGADARRRLLALGLLALAPWYMHAGAGLETPLFAAAVLGVALLAVRRSAWLPAAALLAALIRPEGAALAVAVGVVDLLGRPRRWWWSGGWWAWLFCGGLGLTYLAWRLSYYGELLPNTYYAKTGGVTSWPHLAAFLASCVLLPVVVWWRSGPNLAQLRPWRGLVVALGLWCVLLMINYGRSELLMNYGHRFFMPLLPLVVVALAATWGPVRWSWYLAAHAAQSALNLYTFGVYCYGYAAMDRTEHAPAAAYIAEHAPAGATLAVIVDAGRVPFDSNLRTLDFGALTDHYLARHTDPADRVRYFFDERPEVVLLASGDLGIVAAERFRAALLADPRWTAEYHQVAAFKGPQRFRYHQEVWMRRAP